MFLQHHEQLHVGLRVKRLTLALLLAACGAEPIEATGPIVLTPDAEVERGPEPLPVITLSPSPELLDAATDWAARWSAATGRGIVVGDGGHRIEAQDDVLNDAGKRLCGGTRLSTGIRVARVQAGTCPGMYETLGHELGHLLGADAHTESHGIMDVASDPRPIDAAALELVCANLECSAFRPET
jgi:hypothetical protein